MSLRARRSNPGFLENFSLDHHVPSTLKLRRTGALALTESVVALAKSDAAPRDDGFLLNNNLIKLSLKKYIKFFELIITKTCNTCLKKLSS